VKAACDGSATFSALARKGRRRADRGEGRPSWGTRSTGTRSPRKSKLIGSVRSRTWQGAESFAAIWHDDCVRCSPEFVWLDAVETTVIYAPCRVPDFGRAALRRTCHLHERGFNAPASRTSPKRRARRRVFLQPLREQGGAGRGGGAKVRGVGEGPVRPVAGREASPLRAYASTSKAHPGGGLRRGFTHGCPPGELRRGAASSEPAGL